jgi:preprotein translocase subunit YajC
MGNSGLLKGQRVNSPGGFGEVIETIGDTVVVKLDNGTTCTFAIDDITDESNAG